MAELLVSPSVGTVAEAGVMAPWPDKAAAIAHVVGEVVPTGAVGHGAVAAMLQGRAQRHHAVQGSGSVGSVEVGSVARIAWEVASTTEVTSHGVGWREGRGWIVRNRLPRWE